LIRELKVNDAVIRLRALKIKDFQTHQHIEFSWDGWLTFSEIIELAGVTPIPPYLNRESEILTATGIRQSIPQLKAQLQRPQLACILRTSFCKTLN